MTWQTAVMYVVAALFALAGTGLLMALAAATVLAMSATAMWQWSVEG